jgi:hypothetical protein
LKCPLIWNFYFGGRGGYLENICAPRDLYRETERRVLAAFFVRARGKKAVRLSCGRGTKVSARLFCNGDG